jgi:hypothetical protein
MASNTSHVSIVLKYSFAASGFQAGDLRNNWGDKDSLSAAHVVWERLNCPFGRPR